MIVAVPSKGRAGKVATQKILPSCRLYVPELEAAAYRAGGARNVIEVPNSVRGITETRNWILDNEDDQRIVMIDDDVKVCGRFVLGERSSRQEKLTEDQWLVEFAKLFDVTEDLDYRIWGISTDGALRSVYPYRPFIFRTYVTASCMGIVNDGRTRFDPSFKVKEDYELNLRCLREDGGVLGARFLFWSNEHWTQEGGCKDYRTQDMERDAIRRLQSMYPGMIRVTKRANSPWCIEVV